MSLLIDIVGGAAGACSMASFVPQIVKILRERRAEAISRRMYVVTVTGFSLWTAYGVMLKSWPIMVTNSVCLGLTATILALRLKFGDGSDEA
ncbi:MAG TPA: SemiSWEET transporter [Caulobacteraceae bacterium]